MRSDSEEESLPPDLALAAVLLGVASMPLAAGIIAPLGVRATLAAGQAALVAPGLILLLQRAQTPGLLRSLRVRRPAPTTVAAGLLAGLGLWIMSLGLIAAQFALWPPEPIYFESFKRLYQHLRPTNVIEAGLSLATIALLPAVCEEVLFRGLLLRSLQRSLGGRPALLISSLAFGLIHVELTEASIVAHRVPFAFCVGLGFGALLLRADNLVAPMLAHALLNSVTFGVTLLAGFPEGEPASAVGWHIGTWLLVGAALTYKTLNQLELEG